MSSEICPICHEVIEHGSGWLDGTPIYPGSRLLHPRPQTRVCLECQPRVYDRDDEPALPGWYADLYGWRSEMRWREDER